MSPAFFMKGDWSVHSSEESDWMCNNQQKVVVIGHGFASRLGVIRALGRAGYEVIVVVMVVNRRKGNPDMTPPIDSYSKYISRLYFCLPEKGRLIDLLLEKCIDANQKVVLFPDSDYSAAEIDLNQERLREHFLFPHIEHTPGAIVKWMSKIRQKELAQQVGLNVAKGTVVKVIDGVYELPPTITYPCFPKPLVTLVGAKTGFGRCDTEQQLCQSIDLLVKRSPTISILVEEYIEIEDEYALLGVSNGVDVHIPGILHISSLAQGGHFGVAKRGEISPIDGYESIIEGFKAFVKETHFIGIFDVDFYKSQGQFFFCEMNFRYGGSGYAYTQSGVNLPVMCLQILKGYPIDITSFVRKKSVYVNERMCMDDWYSRFISTREFIDMQRNCDISFVKDEDDPKPYRIYKKEVRRMGIRRFIKYCIGR